MFCIFLQSAEERKVKVFQKGERVVCGSKGVCVVEEITTLDIAGVDKKREYYILKPLYLSSSTVYIPVDTAEGSMRKVLAHEEAENLIHRIPEIPLITIANDKLLEQEYKNCLKTSSCQDLIRIIKTIYLRKRAREEAGRKETAVDGESSTGTGLKLQRPSTSMKAQYSPSASAVSKMRFICLFTVYDATFQRFSMLHVKLGAVV